MNMMDAWFEFQRSRTDGSTDLALDADGTSRHAVSPVAGVFRGRELKLNAQHETEQ